MPSELDQLLGADFDKKTTEELRAQNTLPSEEAELLRFGLIQPTMPTSETTKLIARQIGLNIRFRRSMVKVSQQMLARALGVSYQQVQRYEAGDPLTCAKLVYVARALRCNIEDLYFRTTMPLTKPRPGEENPELMAQDDYLEVTDMATLRLAQAIRALPPRQRRIVTTLVHDTASEFSALRESADKPARKGGK